MEKLFSKIVGTPIYYDDQLRPAARVKDVILDPESGNVLGLFVDSNQHKMISHLDILRWGDVVKINDLNVIIDAHDVFRVEQVLKSGIKIYRNNVETKDGELLGKVVDYAVDVNNFQLKKLYVTKEFFGMVRYSSRIIKADDIIEVLADKIVVKDNLAFVKEKETVKLESIGV